MSKGKIFVSFDTKLWTNYKDTILKCIAIYFSEKNIQDGSKWQKKRAENYCHIDVNSKYTFYPRFVCAMHFYAY